VTTKNPFKKLPQPSPGDRIKADDFKTLSQSLQVMYDLSRLSSTLFGLSFGDAKRVLAVQDYAIEKIMSIGGTEMTMPPEEDASLDQRKVIQVMPTALGEKQVLVVLTEVFETRRLTPNLVGLTYKEAQEKIRNMLGDVTFPAMTKNSPELRGLALSVAIEKLSTEVRKE
jgi:hypothetical protein